MKGRIYITCFIITASISCQRNNSVYDHTAVTENLGQDYYYVGDANESQILRDLKPENSRKIGITIVPAEVIQYNYNKNYIIAKTMKLSDGKKSFEYWIVDKRIKNDSLAAIDSITFFKKIEDMDIKLKARK